MKTSAFLVRRARLLLGLTQAEFAEKLDVENTTISRWECGRMRPSAKVVTQLRSIVGGADHHHSHDLLVASPVYKWLALIDDLQATVVASKGVAEALERVGYTADDFVNTEPHLAARWTKPSDAEWHCSFPYAFTLVQADPRWLKGEIAYVEIHAYSHIFKSWGRGLLAPLLDEGLALFEAVPAKKGPRQGFWMRVTFVDSKGSPEEYP